MTDQPLHKVHLESAQQQQKQLLTEVQELQNQINTKKELILKVQGVIEYLTQIEETAKTETAQPEAPTEPETLNEPPTYPPTDT